MNGRTFIRWVRVVIAGVLTEVGIVLLIVVAATVYRYALSPTEAGFQAFVGRVGFYVGVYGGAPAAFLLALWACRRVTAGFLLHPLLVGCVAALLHVALFVASGAGWQAVYVVADALKVADGVLGGYVAGRGHSLGLAA